MDSLAVGYQQTVRTQFDNCKLYKVTLNRTLQTKESSVQGSAASTSRNCSNGCSSTNGAQNGAIWGQSRQIRTCLECFLSENICQNLLKRSVT
jgi:hypothetical protein